MLTRPLPPRNFAREFEPAPDVEAWIRASFIDPKSQSFNAAHKHLKWARIGLLWTTVYNEQHQLAVAGTAEIPFFQGSAWKKQRQKQQLREWFGEEPDFLITLFAPYCEEADDLNFCSLVEHELYHCAQKRDRYGAPKFSKSGKPAFCLRGHDSEEFVGVMERYGLAGVGEGTRKLVLAAGKTPLLTSATITWSCGGR